MSQNLAPFPFYLDFSPIHKGKHREVEILDLEFPVHKNHVNIIVVKQQFTFSDLLNLCLYLQLTRVCGPWASKMDESSVSELTLAKILPFHGSSSCHSLAYLPLSHQIRLCNHFLLTSTVILVDTSCVSSTSFSFLSTGLPRPDILFLPTSIVMLHSPLIGIKTGIALLSTKRNR